MSQAASLFEFASELVRIHERSAPGRITVVPIVVDDLAAARPVLEALAATLEGRLLFAGDEELQRAVPASTTPVRVAAIETALTTVPAGGNRRVILESLPDDLIDATLQDTPVGTEASAGESEVLGVARAFSHRDLDRHHFAIVAYRDFAIDLPFREAIWRLVVEQLPEMPNERLKTLAVVAETPISIPLHCQTGRGFQLALDGGRLLRRRGRDDLLVAARQLADYADPFVLFLGAGFSASSHLPLGNAMRDIAIRRLLDVHEPELLSSEELALRFSRWIAQHPGWLTQSEAAMREDEYARSLTLEQVIRAERRITPDLPTLEMFRERHDEVILAPGPAARDLGVILEHTQGKAIIVEVNFDRLVETTSRVPLRTFYTDAEFEDAAHYIGLYLEGNEIAIPVLKLHGDIYDFDSCVVSDEQTERGVGAGKLEAMRALLPGDGQRRWIYVGASLRDKDLLPIFRGEDFACGSDERWVIPYLIESIEEFGGVRRAVWRETDLPTIEDRLITETADEFFAAWRAALLT